MSQGEKENLEKLIRSYESRDYDQAIEVGRKFTEKFAHNGTGWNVLGLSYKANGELNEAIKIFKFLIKALPKNAAFVSNLGNTYMLIGRIQDGIQCFKKAVKLQPKLVNAIEALGLAYTEIGRDKDAAKCFARVIQLDPTNQSSAYYLGNLYLNDRNWVKAKDCLNSIDFGLSQSHILECFLCLDRRSEFELHYTKLRDEGYCNPLIGGIVTHAQEFYETKFENIFCDNPISYVQQARVEERDGFTESLRNQLITYHNRGKNDYRGQNLLHNGKQSSGNIFLLNEPFVADLRKCIEAKIEQYRQVYRESRAGFLANWPKEYLLYGWIVSIKEGGNLDAHNHKEGWLSGSLYLSLPDKKGNDGNIAFSNVGPRYPAIDAPIEKKVVDINERDICLFPSSLFHETIPFSSEKERISFAFDVIPRNLKN